MKLGAAALLAALLFLAAVIIQADDERALVPAPQPIELGADPGTASTDSSPSGTQLPTSPEPTWVEHDVDYGDLEDFDDDNSGKGSDNSGSGSDDNSGSGSEDPGSDDNSGSGSDDSGGDDN